MNALPSFVAGGTSIAVIRRPSIVTRSSTRTRAFGYHAGPLTSFARFVGGTGEAVITGCPPLDVLLEPAPQRRHAPPQPGLTTSKTQRPGPLGVVPVSPAGTRVGH